MMMKAGRIMPRISINFFIVINKIKSKIITDLRIRMDFADFRDFKDLL